MHFLSLFLFFSSREGKSLIYWSETTGFSSANESLGAYTGTRSRAPKSSDLIDHSNKKKRQSVPLAGSQPSVVWTLITDPDEKQRDRVLLLLYSTAEEDFHCIFLAQEREEESPTMSYYIRLNSPDLWLKKK